MSSGVNPRDKKLLSLSFLLSLLFTKRYKNVRWLIVNYTRNGVPVGAAFVGATADDGEKRRSRSELTFPAVLLDSDSER